MLTIGQVAERTGLRPSAIRYYEARGLLPIPVRQGGKRIYDDAILERLSAIELAKMAGFGLDEISVLVSIGGGTPALAWKKISRAKRAELDRQMAVLARMKMVLGRLNGCACETLEECGRKYRAIRSRMA